MQYLQYLCHNRLLFNLNSGILVWFCIVLFALLAIKIYANAKCKCIYRKNPNKHPCAFAGIVVLKRTFFPSSSFLPNENHTTKNVKKIQHNIMYICMEGHLLEGVFILGFTADLILRFLVMIYFQNGGGW